jgi:hypothetical protein
MAKRKKTRLEQMRESTAMKAKKANKRTYSG